MYANNSSVDGDSASSEVTNQFQQWTTVLYFAFLVILAPVTVFGNTMTLIAIWKTERLKTTTNKLVMCLAASDLLFGVSIVLYVLFSLDVNQFLNKKVTTIAWMVLNLLTILSSVNSVFLIALERYIYIVHPYSYPNLTSSNRSRVFVALLFAWTLVLSLSLVFFNVCGESADACNDDTVLTNTQAILMIIVFIIQYACMTMFYGAIFRVALVQRKRIQVENTGLHFKRSDLKLVKLMFSVLGIFSLCFVPHMVVFFTDVVANTKFLSSVGSYTGALSMTNSSMNFFIYTIKDSAFRKAIKNLICCRENH